MPKQKKSKRTKSLYLNYANKKPVFKLCELEGCGKEFEVSGKKTRKRYCSDECTDIAKKQREKKRIRGNALIIEKNKADYKASDQRRSDYEKSSGVDPKYLIPRGSRQRKALGLEPIEYSSRGYELAVNA